MAEIISVPPSRLILDASNPRLPSPEGQRDSLRAMAQLHPRKLLSLARDIAAFNLSPAELPIVTPLKKDDLNRYVVLEGNRRLAALMALENPDALVGAVDGHVLQKLRELSRDYQKNPIDLVPCAVVPNPNDARHWIELRHTGENQGAGVVPWGTEESTRFRARGGHLPLHSQALNLLESEGLLSPEERRKVPATSYRRLLGTPEVREKIGITVEDGAMKLLGDRKKVAQALLHIAKDLMPNGGDRAKIAVKDIYTKSLRIKYANSLPEKIVVKPSSKVTDVDNSGGATKAKAKRKPKPVRRGPRDYLIPGDCVLNVTQDRVKDIETELRQLSLSTYTNAISVLFRVFFELSVDSYIATHGLTVSAQPKLREKLLAVTNDLVRQQKLAKKQAAAVRAACQKNSFLAPSVEVMNDYVHNEWIFPAAGDLRAHWNSLQPFAMAIWSP